jgi:hypothetical protein
MWARPAWHPVSALRVRWSFYWCGSISLRKSSCLSNLEHDLIKDVHPQVGKIKEGLETVVAVLKENAEDNLPVFKAKEAQ